MKKDEIENHEQNEKVVIDTDDVKEKGGRGNGEIKG